MSKRITFYINNKGIQKITLPNNKIVTRNKNNQLSFSSLKKFIGHPIVSIKNGKRMDPNSSLILNSVFKYKNIWMCSNKKELT